MHYSKRHYLKNWHCTLLLKLPTPALIQEPQISLSQTCPSTMSLGEQTVLLTWVLSAETHPRPAPQALLSHPLLSSTVRPAPCPGPCWHTKQDWSLTGPGKHIPHPCIRGCWTSRNTLPSQDQSHWVSEFAPAVVSLHLWFLLHHPIHYTQLCIQISTCMLVFRNFTQTVFWARKEEKKKNQHKKPKQENHKNPNPYIIPIFTPEFLCYLLIFPWHKFKVRYGGWAR